MIILFADTETGGFPNDRLPPEHPAQPPLVQLGAVLIDADNGAEWATLELIVKPNGWSIPTSASAVHGITTALAAKVGVPLSLVVASWANLRALADLVVFYNAPFDLAILEIAIARNGKPPSKPSPSVECAMELVTPMCAMPPTARMIAAGRGDQFKNPKLIEAHEHLFDEGFEGAHGALADARATARVWFEAKRRIAIENGILETCEVKEEGNRHNGKT